MFWFTVATVAAVALLWLALPRPSQPPPPPIPTLPSPTATPTPSKATPSPSPTPTATPTPALAPQSIATTTPTPLVELVADRPRRRGPRPTPALSECVAFQWSASEGVPRLGHILIQVSARNRCGRTIGSTELWFEASGYRDGALVHRRRAHPFEDVRNRATVEVAFDLPGSTTWYDQISVRLVE